MPDGPFPPIAYLEFNRFPEWRGLLTGAVLAIGLLGVGRDRLRPLRERFAALSRRRALSLLLLFVLSFALTASLSLRRGLPLPHVHDEFSYLLAADTFAHGRLTNPTPPSPEHFETMHVLVRPTYASKYPPGQGLFMALGQVLTGRPVAGVWLSTALAVAALGWMLYAFVSPPWALLGGLLAAAHPQILEWGNRYWGGNVAVLAGALFLGGLARLVPVSTSLSAARPKDRPQGRASGAAATAVGLLLLANTRPFEGLVFAVLTSSAWGILWWRRTRRILRSAATRGPSDAPLKAPSLLHLPSSVLVLTLTLGFAWMLYYNHRLTGSPLRLPYQEHQRQYATVPLFIFQPKSPAPHYNHDEIRLFYTREQEYWHARHGDWFKLREEAWKNVRRLYDGSLGNVDALAAALLVLPWFFLRSRTIRAMTIVLALLLLALLTETFMYPHYAAPAAGMVAALLLMLLRRLHRLGHPLGPAIARSAVAVAFLWSLFWSIGFFNWILPPDDFAVRRRRVEQQFASLPGRHLILVRYGDHNVHEEWVYNGADLPSAKLLWAREMDPARNRRLLEHFQDRQIWLLEPDTPGSVAVPYTPTPEPGEQTSQGEPRWEKPPAPSSPLPGSVSGLSGDTARHDR